MLKAQLELVDAPSLKDNRVFTGQEAVEGAVAFNAPGNVARIVSFLEGFAGFFFEKY